MTGVFSLITGCRRATPIQDLGDPHQVVDDEYGLTRVHVAARSGNSALLDALLSNGGDPNVEDSSGATAKGRTPLHWALDAKLSLIHI